MRIWEWEVVVSAGWDGSFEERFVELFVRAERVAMRILADREAAEDVAAETMFRALRSWRRVRTYQAPWVTRVAANLAIDALRRRRRRPVELPARREDGGDDGFVTFDAVESLSERQRQAVVLHFVIGFTVAETASVMGLTEGTVKTHLQRASAALRSALGRDKEADDAAR